MQYDRQGKAACEYLEVRCRLDCCNFYTTATCYQTEDCCRFRLIGGPNQHYEITEKGIRYLQLLCEIENDLQPEESIYK